MNPADTTTRTDRESDDERSNVARRTRESLSTVPSPLRRAVESGAATAIVGTAGLLGGLRAFRRGNRRRGLAGVAVGGAFLATALTQWSRGRDAGTGAEETEPKAESASGPDSDTDAESAADRREVGDTERVAGEIKRETEGMRETGDVGEADGTTDGAASSAVGPGTGEVSAEGVEPEEIDRLGEAALDRQSREVPVPQRAFNEGFLSHSSEAFWGIRAGDDAVVVSGNYDAIQDRDGMQYVASTEIGEDVRELPIPDTVLDHWDEMAGGGTAVGGGDDVLFVTTDDLSADGMLRVLPSKWADDVDGSG